MEGVTKQEDPDTKSTLFLLKTLTLFLSLVRRSRTISLPAPPSLSRPPSVTWPCHADNHH